MSWEKLASVSCFCDLFKLKCYNLAFWLAHYRLIYAFLCTLILLNSCWLLKDKSVNFLSHLSNKVIIGHFVRNWNFEIYDLKCKIVANLSHDGAAKCLLGRHRHALGLVEYFTCRNCGEHTTHYLETEHLVFNEACTNGLTQLSLEI